MINIIDNFNRVFRFKDIDIWDIEIDRITYRMFIFDENRPSRQDDFDLGDYEDNDFWEDVLRKNLVTVKVYSDIPVKENHIYDLDQFSKSITNHLALAHCNVIISFYVESIELALSRVLFEKENITEDELPLDRLWHLTQD